MVSEVFGGDYTVAMAKVKVPGVVLQLNRDGGIHLDGGGGGG